MHQINMSGGRALDYVQVTVCMKCGGAIMSDGTCECENTPLRVYERDGAQEPQDGSWEGDKQTSHPTCA